MKLADHPNVRVMFRRHGSMLVGQATFWICGLLALLLAQYGFRNAETPNSRAFAWGALTIGILLFVVLYRLRKFAYLLTDDAISERSGPRLRESPAIRWHDVIAISWMPPLNVAWPRGCVIWASRGGHRDGSHMRGIRWQMAPEIKSVRDELEAVHGPLGAILVDNWMLSKDDTAAMMNVLERHGFDPLPTNVEPCRGLVSYPRRRP